MPSSIEISKTITDRDDEENEFTKQIYLNTIRYIEPRVKYEVPNHLRNAKIYRKVAKNCYVEAKPAVIHFSGFEINQTHSIELQITNISSEIIQMHLLPPQTKYFKLHYRKMERLVPGLFILCTVEFYPDEWRYFYDSIRIHCMHDEDLLIPIHAYPVMSAADFPMRFTFPSVPIGHKVTQAFPLKCFVPVDFEFSIAYLQSNPAFHIEPMSGTVAARGQTSISVTFAPEEYCMCHVKFLIYLSQFNCPPLVSEFTGHSSPGQLKAIAIDDYQIKTPNELTLFNKSVKVNHSIKKSKVVKTSEHQKVVSYGGLIFSTNLDTQHAVNQVLNQNIGKLPVKDIQKAIENRKNNSASNRQMKETIFEQLVLKITTEYQNNQVKWQMKLGDEPITAHFRNETVQRRMFDMQCYQNDRLNQPLSDNEFLRQDNIRVSRRTIRDIYNNVDTLGKSQVDSDVRFDTLKNDTWLRRFTKLHSFGQAAYTVIARIRANKRLKLIKNVAEKMILSQTSIGMRNLEHFLHLSDIENSHSDKEFYFTADKMRPPHFPTYESSAEDDLAADFPETVTTSPVDVTVREKIPFFDLAVPQHYRVQGYEMEDVHSYSLLYVPKGQIRKMRSGAEEEYINMPLTSTDLLTEKIEDTVLIDKSDRKHEIQRHLPLVAPAAMFAARSLPHMFIFVPCPGLQAFHSLMPYSENDPDYHLCPIPRYVSDDCDRNIHFATQREYLHKEEVIKGVMDWKKFPSHGITSISNLPSLTSAWVPRWNSSIFSSDILPDEIPAILNELPEDDSKSVCKGETALSIATPEMIYERFDLKETLSKLSMETATTDEFPFNKKLPSDALPSSSIGHTPRERRQKELEFYITSKYNRVGKKVQEVMKENNELITDQRCHLDVDPHFS